MLTNTFAFSIDYNTYVTFTLNSYKFYSIIMYITCFVLIICDIKKILII